MTNYFVTVGMSLLTSSRCWNGLEGLDAFSPSELRDPRKIAAGPGLFRAGDNQRRQLIDQLNNRERFNDQAKTAIQSHKARLNFAWQSNPALLPAELATLSKLQRALREGDRLLLLHGQNDNEKVAHLLKAALEAWVDDQLLPRITVELSNPFDWDPTQETGFKAAMEDLWRTIEGRLPPGGESAFILTGAYKAILMDLVVKICGKRVPTVIYYLHEDVKELIATHIKVPPVHTGTTTPSPVTSTTAPFDARQDDGN